MARPIVLVPLAVLSTAGLVSCSMYLEANGGDRGPTVTQEREVSDVAALDFDASGDVVLSVGEPSLTLTGGENVLDDLTVEVQGDTLVIDLANGWHSPGRITYDLTLPDLSSIRLSGSGSVTGEAAGSGSRALDLSGSGRIELDGLDAQELDVSVEGSGEVVVTQVLAVGTSVVIDGSGHVRLAGESDRLTVRIPGSGDVDAGDLTAQDVVAAVGGSGSIDLRAEHTLDASVDGSGTITYSGGAAVRTSVSGSGRVAER